MRSQFAGAVLLLSSASGAVAEGHFYVGLGAGKAEVSFDRGLEGDDTALQAFAGYSLDRYFAAEISYLDAGSVDSRFGAALETIGLAATALASLPLGERWSLFVRAGALTWRWESAGIEHEGTDLVYGFGGGVRLGRVQVRLEGGATHLDDDEMRFALLHGLWRF